MDKRIDLATLVAVAVVAFAVANVAHESGGHGLACLAVGAHLKGLNAVYCDCDRGAVSAGASRFISAAGSLANLVVAAVAFAGLRVRRRALAAGARAGALDLALWLLFTIDVLQPAGYLLFSGLIGVGDWAAVIDGVPHAGVLRVVEAVVGAGAYYAVARAAAAAIAPLAGRDDRVRVARRVALTSFVAGGTLYAAAGALNPLGGRIFLISALAAGFGGTSGLTWLSAMLKNPAFAPAGGAPLELARSPAWIAAAVVVAVGFIAVLGRTVAVG